MHGSNHRSSSALFGSLTLAAAATLAAALVLSGCEFPSGVQAGTTYIRIAQIDPSSSPDATPGADPSSSPSDLPASACLPDATAPSDAVCDPFGATAPAATTESGLKATLYYLGDNQPHYDSVRDYILHGNQLNADLFFSQLNVPTRPFDEGFLTQNGTTLLTPAGNTLYEWFALHFDSKLKLGSSDLPGRYQFAVLSDDGSLVDMNPDGAGMHTILNNDGTHASQLACSPTLIPFDANTRVPIAVDYYQGPRYHIAMILLWRRIDPAASVAPAEPVCGASGNDTFFDSSQNPPRATSTWISLLSRGWKVLLPENYLLPATSAANACAGSCFTDRFQNPQWNTFQLSRSGISAATLRVTADGVPIAFRYDPILNVVYVPTLPVGAQDVHIGFCLAPPTASPSPSVSATPSASPTTSPTPTPTGTPTPSPTPTCQTIGCGGPVIGV